MVKTADLEDLDSRFLQHGSKVFAIERFDRPLDGRHVHQEDFAQVRCLLPEYKYHAASYEGLARFIGDLCGPSDLIEYIRRLFFSIAAGNTDAHLKNWSLIYPDGKTARLSPAYDMVSVRQYKVDDKLALKLANENVPERLSWDHVRRLERYLEKFGHPINVVDIARDTIETALTMWNMHQDLGTHDYRLLMDKHLSGLPLAIR
jgi:serine/threonine-protein kinase HipA